MFSRTRPTKLGRISGNDEISRGKLRKNTPQTIEESKHRGEARNVRKIENRRERESAKVGDKGQMRDRTRERYEPADAFNVVDCATASAAALLAALSADCATAYIYTHHFRYIYIHVHVYKYMYMYRLYKLIYR